KSFDFEPVTIDENPDFNTKSLRSNVVFRWEYRRGSTLYLVYNVANSDDARPGLFSAFRDLRTGFGAAGTQVLMVKFNYWLGLVGFILAGANGPARAHLPPRAL